MRILIIPLLFSTFGSHVYSQSGMGSTPGYPDPNMSPINDYGGALGGANSTPSPSSPSYPTVTTPQEQQESNVLGGAREGVIDSPTSTPSTLETTPDTPPTEATPLGREKSFYPAGSGTGTGIGTGIP